MSLVTLDSRMKVNDDVLFHELLVEAVLLSLKSGVYFAWTRWGRASGSFSPSMSGWPRSRRRLSSTARLIFSIARSS